MSDDLRKSLKNNELPPPPEKFGPEFRSRLPQLLLVSALALAAFAYGGLVVHYELFPYPVISDGIKTLQTLHHLHTRRELARPAYFADVPPERAVANRFQFVAGDALSGPVLWQGGRYQFLEYCPDWGCLAVEYTATGEVAHAYPFRNEELEQAAVAAQSDEFPHELSPAASFTKHVVVIGISRYANGDLLAVFHQLPGAAFPYGAGVARIDRDGHPVWFRRDYSHHWPHIEADGVALVPGALIGSESISFKLGQTLRKSLTLKCGTNRPYLDAIGMIDGNGRLSKRINLLDALRDSPFAYLMSSTSEPQQAKTPCDPLHLNSVHRLGDDAGGTWGLAPGDLVASLRNLSAFAILDGESGRVKRLVRGSFFYQHSVHHLTGATFLMFDNCGHNGTHGPSRLLMIDLADGRETTIFPNAQTPEPLQNLFSHRQGVVDISPDRRRAIVSFSAEGVAVEVRLADGAVLNAFHSLHDVSNLEQFPQERQQRAARFRMRGLYYIRN